MRSTAVRAVLILTLISTACGGGGGDLDVTVTVDPASGPPGTTIAVEAAGCDARPEPFMNALGNGLEDSSGEEVAEIRFTGAEQGTLTVPEDAPAGTYTVRVACPSGTTEDGSINVANSSTTFEVTE